MFINTLFPCDLSDNSCLSYRRFRELINHRCTNLRACTGCPLPPDPRLGVHEVRGVRGRHYHVGGGGRHLQPLPRLGTAPHARLPVSHQHGHRHPPRRRQRVGILLIVQPLLVLRPFRLVPKAIKIVSQICQTTPSTPPTCGSGTKSSLAWASTL